MVPADAVVNVHAAHADVDASVRAPRSEQQAPSVQWVIRVEEAPDGSAKSRRAAAATVAQAAAVAAVIQANWAARRAAAADDCWANADRVIRPAWVAWRPARAAGVEHVHVEPLSCWPAVTERSLRASTWRPCPAAAYAVVRCKGGGGEI